MDDPPARNRPREETRSLHTLHLRDVVSNIYSRVHQSSRVAARREPALMISRCFCFGRRIYAASFFSDFARYIRYSRDTSAKVQLYLTFAHAIKETRTRGARIFVRSFARSRFFFPPSPSCQKSKTSPLPLFLIGRSRAYSLPTAEFKRPLFITPDRSNRQRRASPTETTHVDDFYDTSRPL